MNQNGYTTANALHVSHVIITARTMPSNLEIGQKIKANIGSNKLG
jgi:hypothetical protein